MNTPKVAEIVGRMDRQVLRAQRAKLLRGVLVDRMGHVTTMMPVGDPIVSVFGDETVTSAGAESSVM